MFVNKYEKLFTECDVKTLKYDKIFEYDKDKVRFKLQEVEKERLKIQMDNLQEYKRSTRCYPPFGYFQKWH